MSNLTEKFVQEALDAQSLWDLGNNVLYKLCADHPFHTEDNVIIAKTWLIGRAYAAAVERRRILGPYIGDAFYENCVAPKIREANIDTWLRSVRDTSGDNPQIALVIHKKMINLLKDITGINKRSFASKYLHFHFPMHFFIYDVRSVNSVRELTGPTRERETYWDVAEVDRDYAEFFSACRHLGHKISSLIGRSPTPREVDKILLHWSAHPAEH